MKKANGHFNQRIPSTQSIHFTFDWKLAKVTFKKRDFKIVSVNHSALYIKVQICYPTECLWGICENTRCMVSKVGLLLVFSWIKRGECPWLIFSCYIEVVEAVPTK